MGWKHQQSHPPTSTSNNLSSNVRRQHAASEPSLQLGCEVACQLPSHWASSVHSHVTSFGGAVARSWWFHLRCTLTYSLRFMCVWEWLPGKSPSRDGTHRYGVFTPQDDWQDREWEGRVYHIWGSLPSLLYCSNREGTVTYISQTPCLSNTHINRHTSTDIEGTHTNI